MNSITRKEFQAFPYHLVEPSPWKEKNIFNYYCTKNYIDNNIFIASIYKSNLLYPLCFSDHIKKALSLGEIMYKAIPDNNPVKGFVKNKLADQLVEICATKKTEGQIIPKSIITFSDDKPLISISKKAGCYIYTHTSNEFSYIGSAYNFNERHKTHKDALRTNKTYFYKFIKENGGLDSFYLGVVYLTPNFLVEFKSKYPYYKLNKGELIFLTHLTELFSKTLEQSLISGASPNLNTQHSVFFIYKEWNDEWLNQIVPLSSRMKSLYVYYMDIEEPILGPISIRESIKLLGVSKDMVPKYLNHERYFMSPSLGFKVRVQELGESIKNTNEVIVHRAKVNIPKIDYDLDSLSLGKIFVLKEDNTLLNNEGFDSVKDAVKQLDPIKYDKLSKAKNTRFEYISRYINLNRKVNTVSGSYFFIANPITLYNKKNLHRAIPIILVNIKSGNIENFHSISYMCKALGIKRFNYLLYLDKSRIWRTEYRLFSLEYFTRLNKNNQYK